MNMDMCGDVKQGIPILDTIYNTFQFQLPKLTIHTYINYIKNGKVYRGIEKEVWQDTGVDMKTIKKMENYT